MSSDDQIRAAIVNTLCELIAIPSTYPPGDTASIAAYAAGRLRKAGYDVDIVTNRPPIQNVVARLGRGKPSLVFNDHADTVAPGDRADWRTDPFVGTGANGRIHGLGACNCKGSMAVHLWLAEEIARRGGPRNGEVVFTFVGDEESLGPDGMRHLRESGRVRPDMLVVGAPTDNQLITEERGVFWARLTAMGRSAHAGEPHQGDNAVLRMMRLVAAIEGRLQPALAKRSRSDMRSTMNVGVIAGGTTPNVVPSRCTVEIDRRLLPGETVTAAFAELRDAAAASGEPEGTWSAELLTGTNGFAAPQGARVVSAFAESYRARMGHTAKFIIPAGASDGRYFSDAGIEILVTGPGDGAEGHAANESIGEADLVAAAHIQLGAVERLLGLKG